ncbi:MAG: response regulator [Pseudomonadota bacterium]
MNSSTLKVQPKDSLADKRVLIVDDETDIIQLLESMLAATGCEVVTATGAGQALQLCDEGLQVDLILMDVILPCSINGGALSKELKTRLPGTPVVFMSGYAENSVPQLGQRVGDTAMLQKPFSRTDLISTLESILIH